MKPKKLLIWGASGHARIVADIVRLCGEYEIAGFLDNVNLERHGTEFCGALILGGEEKLIDYRDRGVRHVILAFGDCEVRHSLSAWVKEQGFILATAVHPSSVIASDATVAPGVVVAAGAVINSMAVIGESTIINTLASVDHDCLIGPAVHVSPGAHLGGRVTVGCATWIGIGAIIRDGVHIGGHTVVGAGAVVVADLPASVVAYGVPAKPINEVQ